MEQKWELTKKLNKEGKNLVNKRREKKVTGGSASSVFLEIVNTCNQIGIKQCTCVHHGNLNLEKKKNVIVIYLEYVFYAIR